ncbi:MAG: PD-(D/E)XK nuclease family protein [Thermonemataceae bacterium]|nr:PD-(D/E)XK nuclease family protein [Thermonemataceae bacterium]
MSQINLTDIEKLLLSVNAIAEKYNKVAQQTGVNFNIFNVLNIRSQEVKHSVFIAELLNPKGRHGYGERFLELFLEEIALPENKENLKNASIEVEKYACEYGRIDIYISFPDNKNIIIENKIYAGDQHEQMRRYYNFQKEAHLIYLTLDGKEPTEESLLNHKETKETVIIKPTLLSYKEHIKNWLEKCLKEAVDKPFIRENIAQYLNIVKELTHQSIFNEMANEITKQILQNKEFINSAQIIHNHWYEVMAEIITEIKNEIKPIEIPLPKENNKIIIDYEFEGSNYNKLSIGIRHEKVDNFISEQSFKELQEKLNLEYKNNYPNEWICYGYLKEWESVDWCDVAEFSKKLKIKLEEIGKAIQTS